MKYWDCFLFNSEFECLKIRAEELKPLNSTHVLVDGKYSFTGNKQRIPFFEHEGEEFFDYNVREFIVEDAPIIGNPWANETKQRNAILTALMELGAKDEDIVIISDADEIPSLKAVQSYKPEMGLTALRMDNFWYKFNCLTERQSWMPARILTFEELKKSTPNDVRNSGYPNSIDNGGWHFSYLGNADFIVNKIQSYSHTEFNKPEIINDIHIEKCMESGIPLWGSGVFQFIPVDHTFPRYIKENQSEFKHLIKKI